mmetsp:Transcript_5019/g.12629  ORF Transcript_5019/g.12629 Transcript_5019/m.12629 type:complete len:535 (+) Transcript_5019:192-1796(+)
MINAARTTPPNGPAGINTNIEKLRVLCLHGFRTNSHILHLQIDLSVLSTPAVRKYVDFVCVDAPHRTEDERKVPAVIREVFGNRQKNGYREWWNRDDDGNLNGKEESMAFLKGKLDIGRSNFNKGNSSISRSASSFDGILGFSQGGAVSLLFLQELSDDYAAAQLGAATAGAPRSSLGAAPSAAVVPEDSASAASPAAASDRGADRKRTASGSYPQANSAPQHQEPARPTTSARASAAELSLTDALSPELYREKDGVATVTKADGKQDAEREDQSANSSSTEHSTTASSSVGSPITTRSRTSSDASSVLPPPSHNNSAVSTPASTSMETSVPHPAPARPDAVSTNNLFQGPRTRPVGPPLEYKQLPKFAVILSSFAPRGFNMDTASCSSSLPNGPNGPYVSSDSDSCREDYESFVDSSAEEPAQLPRPPSSCPAPPPPPPRKYNIRKLPLLFMGQRDDKDIPLSRMKSMQRVFPDSVLVENSEGGHKIVPPHQCSAENTEKLARFFRERWEEKFGKKWVEGDLEGGEEVVKSKI